MKTQVASVSSASQLDEEGSASESSTELKGHTVLEPPNPSTFDQPEQAPSPAPVPIQGGDDEVIQVSAVRKIKVNITESGSKTRHIVESPLRKQEYSIHPSPDTTSKGKESFNKEKNMKDLDRDEEESPSDSEPMDVIEKSPYENNMDAEKGVELFTRMKNVLKERKEDDDYRTVNEEATKIFGPTNAWCLVKANALIEKSGMVYSQEWCKGNIRGNQIGKIPKELLLLCLVSKRFTKAQDQLLSGLTRDFEISTIVQEAITGWKLSPTKYQKILGTPKNYQFATRRRDCYKCAIFVARAYSCYKAFHVTGQLEPSLRAKIIACLDLMEEHLPAPTKKRKKSMEPVAADTDVPDDAPSNPANSSTRLRGRLSKNVAAAVKSTEDTQESASQDSLLDDENDMVPYNPPARKTARKSNTTVSKHARNSVLKDSSEEGEDESDMVPYNPPNRGKSSKNAKTTNISNAQVVPSLSSLIAKFEQQYQAMGELYQQVGQTLQQVKAKIRENRPSSEQEIRAELLREIEDNVMKIFRTKRG